MARVLSVLMIVRRALPQVIQPPPKPGALIRPPQVTLTQTPMVALRQPHSRIVLTAPQQIQLNQLQPGKKHGITELHPDVVSYVSHATQQRLQNLVEKISETAQQKNFSYKVLRRYPEGAAC
ncbi:hypothetical protein CB1_000243025 [Camelus ferus]|nr:hypothetical protein CB1_000243025 [Camelus ferus]